MELKSPVTKNIYNKPINKENICNHKCYGEGKEEEVSHENTWEKNTPGGRNNKYKLLIKEHPWHA